MRRAVLSWWLSSSATASRRIGRRVAAFALIGLMLTAGCTRRFYRHQVDRDVAEVLGSKDVIPNAAIENYHPYPDDRARFADGTNPDRPPMPPDDPYAKLLSPNPQRPKHAGVGRYEGEGYLELLAIWDAENRAKLAGGEPEGGAVQTTAAQEPLNQGKPAEKQEGEVAPAPRKLEDCKQQPFLITLEQAVELGVINSREFQAMRENLYLAALPVTLERFSFAWQFLAAEDTIREYTGANTPNGKGDHWQFNSGVGVSKLFSTGALLLFSFANRTVVDLSGRMNSQSVSTINLDFVQPFLRGGGRAVTLEPLTGVERNLVYEIRDYARFRKEYFQYITGGSDLATFRGTVAAFGRAIAPGTVTLDSGNPVRPQITPAPAGRVDLTITPPAPSTGFLPTVLNQGFVTIDRQDIGRTEKVVKLFQAYEEGGEVSSLQVGQAQSQLLDSQSRLLQDEKLLRDSLDTFKLQLGVPPPLPLELDASVIQPIMRQFDRFETIITEFENTVKQLEGYDALKDAALLRERLQKLFTESALVKGTQKFQKAILDRWRAWEKDKVDDKAIDQKITALYKEKERLLDLKTDREKEDKTLTPEEGQLLARTLGEISLGDLERTLRVFERMPWLKEAKGRDQLERHAQLFRQVRNAAVEILGEAGNERKELIRPLWPALPSVEVAGVDLVRSDVDTTYEAGTGVAMNARLDLMNARAQLVDAWRQIAIYANSLLGAFNVGYHMDSSTPPGRIAPFSFNPTRTRHQLFLNTELPLVRLAERNNYRAALIAYQRARRTLMEAEDQVANQVRADLRQVQVLARNYPIQQLSVELAFQNVESALEQFRAPQPPGAANNAGSIAGLTQQLLNQYQRLPGQQRLLLGTWIQYQIARQQLYLDLELMPLDSRGVWIDELAKRPLPSRPDDPGVNP